MGTTHVHNIREASTLKPHSWHPSFCHLAVWSWVNYLSSLSSGFFPRKLWQYQPPKTRQNERIMKNSPHVVHSESSKMAAVIFLLSKLSVECSAFGEGTERWSQFKKQAGLLLPGDRFLVLKGQGKQAPSWREFADSYMIQCLHWRYQDLASSLFASD